MMIVRGVNVFPTQIEEQILRVDGLAPHYVCVLTRPGRMDELLVQVEVSDGDLLERRDQLAQQLTTRVKDLVGVTISVEVVDPYALERSLGKAKRIDDRR
jgi:phenylacetate-CoA ligase